MTELTQKRVCLFTGASGRLGTAFCRAHSSRYAIAAVYCRTPPCGIFEGAGEAKVFAIQADLVETEAASAVVEAALTRFGTIDLLVNAAAISRWAPIVGSENVLDNIEEMLALNAVVPLRLAAAVAEQCWRCSPEDNVRANRNVVNVSSTAGLYVYRDHGQSGYAASKAAINMLTCHLAAEFSAFGVRANVVAPNSFPGYVSTEAVAAAIARLDAGSMTGQILVLDSDGETVL